MAVSSEKSVCGLSFISIYLVNIPEEETTSYFIKPARDFILNNNLFYQIKTHDYNTIQQLLNTVV